jgi:molybdopterin/thiamine biosynthesis adenylyltransferase/rhodanese-related sulfurtransferase
VAKTLREMLKAARQVVPEVQAEAFRERMREGDEVVLIDVRDPDEYRDGHLRGARHLSRGFLEFRIEEVAPDRSAPLVLYCRSGLRSILAAQVLKDLGYERVESLAGGYLRWTELGLPTVKPLALSDAQRARYSRHLALPQVGEEGQQKLLQAKVLLVGAGGLGSPAAVYLAAAGVGTLGLVDGDVVDVTNLQRQIVHTTANVGKPKPDSAAEMLAALNPDVKVVPYRERLTEKNAMELLAEYDLVLDGADNFEAKYLVNDAGRLAGKPVVFGSIFQFQGQASVFHPREGPCYRCIFPSPPPPGLVPS